MVADGLDFLLPMENTVAPSPASPFQSVRLLNRAILPTDSDVVDIANWTPQGLGIHY